jgi:transcription initiation factor TFIID subunit TAF12
MDELVLNIADEHLDTIGQFACGLAKHRKSDTIDRKDIQVAYG